MVGSKSDRPWLLLRLLAVLLVAASGSAAPVAAAAAAADEAAFDENYAVQWGADGYHLVIRGTEANITMDQSSGAGFRSKFMYGSVFFHMRMKLPSSYTAGVVTTFYLISQPEDGSRDEVDFEFLGDKAGVPVSLQTNVFVNGRGDREQRLHLWFDPAADFHDYKILWNPYQLVMFVDDTPIRVLRNLTATVPGYPFPARQTMLIRASVWDGSGWATAGGRTKVDWSQGPFTAGYRGFGVSGCANNGSATPCGSPDLWWNGGDYRNITAEQRAAYEGVKKNYMNYD
ncbi:hypothetical protein PVAP13_4NG106400 [Panicum virgatum]|uniref:GH16 domain-containing protein n=1 Tax=Panicum virgatum TaxID=38727 RepID=A0A8T0T7C7_PANVG|nr:hypothetical protein PVAP13_4NG106400 [Panicum virgatum]